MRHDGRHRTTLMLTATLVLAAACAVAQDGSPHPDLPPEFKQRYMNAIVGFEVRILNFDNVFKLSQNRDYKSYENIISKLQKGNDNDQGIASEMAKRINEVFPDR